MRLVLLMLSACLAIAHDSPEHKISGLSLEMARTGASPPLLVERAIEHRILGQLTDAAADLEMAYRLDPRLAAARKELSLVQLAQGKPDLALRTINDVLATTSAPDFLMARAEIQIARKDYAAALKDCEAAFRAPTDNLEWYLLRAQLQRRLGRFADCLAGVRDGFAKTGSAVLGEEIVDAMIDAGHHKAALKTIERELQDARWGSSWLIRRARIRLRMDQTKAAKADIKAALTELNARIVPSAPDVNLIVERGIAHALSGNMAAAEEDLKCARTFSPDPFSLWPLERLLGHLTP